MKADNGVMLISSAQNTSITGTPTVTINAGAVRISDANALGSASVAISPGASRSIVFKLLRSS